MADLTKAELQAALDKANAENAQLTAQLAEANAENAKLTEHLSGVAANPSADWKVPDPAILTRSQCEALTHEQRQAFQRANGTVIEDPAN
jgi:hypothetical protein